MFWVIISIVFVLMSLYGVYYQCKKKDPAGVALWVICVLAWGMNFYIRVIGPVDVDWETKHGVFKLFIQVF